MLEVVSEEAGSIREPLSVSIAWWELALASLAVLINVGVSMSFKLDMHAQLVVSTVRMVLQLTLLGYMLVPVMEWGAWWLVLLTSAAMVAVNSIEAVSRPAFTYKGMLRHMLVSISAGVCLMLTLSSVAVLRVRPFYIPQVFIPVLGTLLDNAISGVSAGLGSFLQELATGREQVDLLLSLGASRSEAIEAVVQRSLAAALGPTLTQMGVVGLVTMPGLMSGMILQGASPVQASRIQVCLVFMMAGTTAVSSVMCILLAARHLVDEEHMTRPDRLRPRTHDAGLGLYLGSKLLRISHRARHLFLRLRISCCGLRLYGGGGTGTSRASSDAWWRSLAGSAHGGRDGPSRAYRFAALGPASDDFEDFLSMDGCTDTSTEAVQQSLV